MFKRVLAAALSLALQVCGAQVSASPDMQLISNFEIDRSEVTIGQFEKFAQSTRHFTVAEQTGGGNTYENGWEQRKGWNWRAPYGKPGAANEPVVHVTYQEAELYCRWAGKRLPTDAEWGEAAYTEKRSQPSGGFVSGKTYVFPTGDTPKGANCLGDCGLVNTVSHAVTSRGKGHALTGTTLQGVNGLFDMGGNVWEWVDSGPGNEKRTRGGSWWYGSVNMRNDHVQSKPASMSAVYIGFRCARNAKP